MNDDEARDAVIRAARYMLSHGDPNKAVDLLVYSLDMRPSEARVLLGLPS
jgi:hypothetical protein